jgi:hypothetical protein
MCVCVRNAQISSKLILQTSTWHNPPHSLPDIIRRIEQITVCALPFSSAISYFKICAWMNQSLIPPSLHFSQLSPRSFCQTLTKKEDTLPATYFAISNPYKSCAYKSANHRLKGFD